MRRLELYEMETLPIIQYYRRAGHPRPRRRAGAETDEVFKRLVEVVESRFDRADRVRR